MQKYWFVIFFLLTALFIKAQTFNGTGGAIPGTATTHTCFPLTVSGVGTINSTNGLASVRINITHPRDEELEILLRAPDGTYVPLSIQNGLANNYTNTVFTPTATLPIKFGSSPFTGNFLPEGHLGAVNNGQNADGSWSLCILDRRTAGNAGSLVNWSLTFNTTPASVPPAIPACTTTIPSSADCASASNICDFNGACGSTVSTPKQSWPALDAASCFGLNNNTFVKFIASGTTASFSVWVTTSNNGFNSVNGGIQMLFFSTPSCGSPTVTSHGCYNRIYPYPPSGRPLVSVIYATGLTPGNTYYLLMDGANGDQCNFTLAANSGVNILSITPATPSICEGQSVNLTASGGNGSYTWSPGTGLNTTNGATVTANPAATATYTVNSVTSTGCPLTKDVTVTVNAPPIVTTQPNPDTQRVCQNGAVTPYNIVATAGSGTITNYQWYINTVPSYTGAALFPPATTATFTPFAASVGTLYFFCRVTNSNGCSDTSAISGAFIVSAPPATPTASATTQPTCLLPTGTITVTAPVGATIEYSNGGAYQTSGTFTNLAPGTYSITARDTVTKCISAPRSITINNPPAGPAIPTGSVTVQPTCTAPTGTIEITAPLGTNIEYSNGGAYQPGTSFTNLTNGTTYAITARDNITGCISDTLRLTVNTIPGAPDMPTASITVQPSCSIATGTITITAPTGVDIEYSIGGTSQSGTQFTGLTPGTTYPITAINTSSGCTSAPLILTIGTIPAPPAPPAVADSVKYCQNSVSAALSATGSNILWYTQAVGGTGVSSSPVPSTSVTGTTTYYASQTIAGCESSRDSTKVLVTAPPPAPTVSATPVEYCQNATAISLTATGTGLLWYTTATGGTGSATAPIPGTTAAATTFYWVSQTINGCESARSVIEVQVKATPALPTVPTQPIAYCENVTAAQLTATGTGLLWYSTSTGGTGTATAPTPVTSSTGSTFFYVSQTIAGCESPRASIEVVVNAIPAAPAVAATPIEYCANATSTALTATGTNLLWYTSSAGGTGSSTAPVPATGSTGSTFYYVSQTVNGCESGRAAIEVTINAVPAAPVVLASLINYCQNQAASVLSATGTNLLWYTTSTGGTGSASAPTPSTTASGNTFYYVSQNNGNCESPRAVIEVIVNAIPSPPAVPTQPIAYCENVTAAPLTATGTGLLWYSTLTGGTGSNSAPTPVTTSTGSTFFYVSQTVGTCESPRATIEVVVNAIPAPPTVTATPIGYCEGATANALTATGTNLLWYSTSAGGTGTASAPIPSTVSSGSTFYYVSQTINGCESPRAAIEVVISLAPVPPTVAATSIPYCQNTAAIQLSATGTNLLWYTAATGGTGDPVAPTPSTTTAGNRFYYVSQTINGCESGRTAIEVIVNASPAAPTVTATISYCENVTAAILTATGSNLLWYTAGMGGSGSSTAPTPPTTTPGNYFYFVSQTINACESNRSSIEVIVNPTPALPAIPADTVSYCQYAAASALTATGVGLKWYTVATGGTVLSGTPVPITTAAGNTNYYVSQTINGCEGPRRRITVRVLASIPPPTVTSPVTYCQNDAAIPLTAVGTSLLWYTSATGGTGTTIAPTPSTTTPGNTFYYVTQTLTGCESPRRAITVTVNLTTTAVAGFRYNPDTICVNNGLVHGPTYAFGFTNGGRFTSLPAGLNINASTGNITLASSTVGTYTVTYTYNTTGCVIGNTASTEITLLPEVPVVTVFSYNSPVCKNEVNPVPNKRAGFTEGGTYAVSPIGGLVINNTTGEIDLAASVPGSYNISYTVDALGCRPGRTSFSFITISDTSTPVTQFSYSPATICITNPGNPVITKAPGFNPDGSFTASPPGLAIDEFTGEITMGLSQPGVYTVNYNVPTFLCRLEGNYSTTFTITPYAAPVTSFSYTQPVCKGEGTTLPIPDTDFTAGGRFSAPAGVSIDSITGTIDLEQSTAGNYTIRYAVPVGACNPAGAGTTPIEILSRPLAPVVTNDTICGPGTATLLASASGSIGWYAESSLVNQVNAGASFSPAINGSTTYYLTNTVGSCVSETSQVTAVVIPIPIAPYLGRDTSICSFDQLVLNATGAYNSYLWQDGSTRPTLTVSKSDTYRVTVSTGAGCEVTSSILINVLDNCDDINFPTAFSPNGDGRNDYFSPLGNLFLVKNYTLKVFNRYGEVVFASNNPYQKWDGNYKGKQPGVHNFVWVASYTYRDRRDQIKKGNLVIVQ